MTQRAKKLRAPQKGLTGVEVLVGLKGSPDDKKADGEREQVRFFEN